jgi:hypothetical protein
MNSRFINMTHHGVISRAIQEANKLLDPISPMILEVSEKDDWKYNSGSGSEVASRLAAPVAPVEVYTYRPRNSRTSAISGYEHGKISLNIYKLDKLTDLVIIANLVHEYAHYRGFNHGTGIFRNYKTKHKCLYSVPYYLSEGIRAGKWL